jgi:1,4-alpha-glucan branching enzyme
MSLMSREPDDVVEVARSLDSLFEGGARTALERALPAYVSSQRWYRTKTKRVHDAHIKAAFPLAFEGRRARIVLAELSLDDGARDTYVLPLAFASGDEARSLRARSPHAIVMPLRVTGGGGGEGLVVDALVQPGFVKELLAGMGRRTSVSDAGATLRFHGLTTIAESERQASGLAQSGTLEPRLVDREQTNTSVLYGERFVGKIVRKLDPSEGESADLEMGRFLTAVGYTHTPPLEGWIDLEVGGATSTVALLHGFVRNHGDAWTHALSVQAEWLSMAERRGATPPDVADTIGPYASLAEKLGQRVGEMHVALASRPHDRAFAPEPLDRSSREATVAALDVELGHVLDALDGRTKSLSDGARAALSAVRAGRSELMARLAEVARREDAGVKMRVHGDLHLGQVLFTGDDFAIIDFEGEPARPLAERKAKRSPLVDVAGMLRSFHYASVSALRACPEASRASLAPWASFWHRAVSAAFMRGWLTATRGSVVVPRDSGSMRALLDLFLLEKCIYEVHYEMNNRPEWLEIPLEGLRDAAERPRSLRERPRSLLGAHVQSDGTTEFRVWAPRAQRVDLVGDFNEWSSGSTPLARTGEAGIFAGRVRGAAAGQRYKYRITPAGGGQPFDKTDPFGVACEPPPGNASVIETLSFDWTDSAWQEKRVQYARMDRPISVYEVHLGSWRRKIEGGDRMLGYREIAAPLAAHAKAMGFTHVELMPLLEHPFYGSWGYGVTGFFAATSRYGGPRDLMYLVDVLHEAGLGVIFDWVPAHFACDAHGLGHFDGSAVFESADPARAVHPTWGSGVFDFAKPEVRSFLLSSATFWIETFHADGLRIDGVESILYENHHGGKEDPAGIAFLRELTTTLKKEHPNVLLAAEDASAWPGVTRAVAQGGLGFDLKWDMGFSHDMRCYLAIDPIHRSHQQDKLTFRSVYASSESFIMPLSHDDVIAERGGSLLEQMHGDPWQKLANLRLLYSMMFAQPGKKLLFMGDEFAQPSAWHHDRSLDWHVAQEPPHDGMARMIGDLNRLYRELPALHAGDASREGFEWIDGGNAEMSVIVFARRSTGAGDVVVAFNFTPVPRHGYRIGVPRAGYWREIFNSDAREYGGSGHGNMGGVDAVPYPWNGRPSSMVVTLPPLGAVFFSCG